MAVFEIFQKVLFEIFQKVLFPTLYSITNLTLSDN